MSKTWIERGAILVALLAATLPAGAVTIEITPDAADGLIVGEGRATAMVTITPGDGDAGQYELRQQYVDRYGEQTDGPSIPVDLADKWEKRLPLAAKYYGPATYKVSLVKDGQDEPVATAERTVIRPVPVPRLTEEQRLGSSIGMNVHNNAHWRTLAAMGVHWARDYSWGWLGRCETLPIAPNKIDFTNTYQDADKAGITILPIMQRSFRTKDNKFFIEDTDAIAAAYERLSKQWPMIKYWELDNEADLEHRTKSGPDYEKWLQTYLGYIKAADQGLKAAGNGAKVVLNGDAGIHPGRTAYLIDEVGEHFAVVNYHYYTGTVAPEPATHDINTGAEDRPQTVSFMDLLWMTNGIAHAADKETWFTEIAWSADGGPAVGFRLQSAYLGRLYMLARWAGVDKTFWFWDRNLGGKGRFSGTGLIADNDGDNSRALPAGAALAAVSKFIAVSRYIGSAYIGPDRRCLMFQQPDGQYVVGAWAIEGQYDLPEPLAAAEEAFGMYGNPLRDRRLTDEPAYFILKELPALWLAQADAEWVSPTTINVSAGGSADVEVQIGSGTEISFNGLPEGVTAGAWKLEGKLRKGTLQIAPEVPGGEYDAAAVITGEGWTKAFALNLKVAAAVDIEAEPYTPGKESKIELTSLVDQPLTAELLPADGEAVPAKLELAKGKAATATFTAPAEITGPIDLAVELSNGATQYYWIRPRHLLVPKVEDLTIDGDLSDWPTDGDLPPESLKIKGADSQFAPLMQLAWSPKGLYIAAEIPVGDGFVSPSKPGDFWEWTSIETSFNAADMKSEAGVTRQHLLWFAPYKDNDSAPWRIYAGEWLKLMEDGEKKTLNDDKRCTAAMTYADGMVVIEALVPVEVLGSAPAAGHTWPLAISAKKAAALSPKTIGAWPAGEGKGWEGWGRITFGE